MSADETVVIDTSEEPYRYACPRGHTGWTLRDGVIACRSCPYRRVPGTVEYDVVMDQKFGREISVESVVVE